VSVSSIIGPSKRTVLNRVNERVFVQYARKLCLDGNVRIYFEDLPVPQM
jgi:hypothetical protein